MFLMVANLREKFGFTTLKPCPSLNFTLFFTPLNQQDFADINKEDALKNHINIHFDKIPKWKGMDIAIIGLTEIRGSVNKTMDINAAQHIRRQLYQLKNRKS